MTSADQEFPLVRSTVAAAERGVRVCIILNQSCYVREHNREFAQALSAADANDLPLEVRLVGPRSRFEKVHTKGVIVDERHVVIGSINLELYTCGYLDHSLEST